MKEGLSGLDGSAKVEQVSFKNGIGVYSVTLPQTYKYDSAALTKAVGRFTLERVDLKIVGEVGRDPKGLWLTSKSGARFLLTNRPKKDDKDSPPDVFATIVEGLKAGKTTFSISGEVKDGNDATTVHLESASVVEKKTEEKK